MEIEAVGRENLDAPPCFPSAEAWELWLNAARADWPRHGYCTDCEPAYRNRHKRTGTCLYPKTVFVVDSDGYIEGQRR